MSIFWNATSLEDFMSKLKCDDGTELFFNVTGQGISIVLVSVRVSLQNNQACSPL